MTELVADSATETQAAIAAKHRIVVFGLATTGHHPVYIRYLVQHWQQERLPGTLFVVVSPEFLVRHAEVAAIALNTPTSKIEFVAISAEDDAAFKQIKSFRARPFADWRLFCQYARQLNATQGLLLSFDSLQLPLLFGAKSPCPVSGIYYAPTFHYRTFHSYQPTSKDKLRQLWQQCLLFCTLKHPKLNALFCLDHLAIDFIQKLGTQAHILPLADPVSLYEHDPQIVEQLRSQLEIDPARRTFLLFGELSGRKGIYQVLEAMQLLYPEQAQQLCLVLAGSLSGDRDKLKALIEQVQKTTKVQLIVCDRYIKGRDVQSFFELADVVLAPYQRHIGMSNVIVLAASLQKPTLASNYGLMGELTRRHELGLAIDSTQPQLIAEGITRFLENAPSTFCNLDKMKQFAEQNHAERFATTILNHLTQNFPKPS